MNYEPCRRKYKRLGNNTMGAVLRLFDSATEFVEWCACTRTDARSAFGLTAPEWHGIETLVRLEAMVS